MSTETKEMPNSSFKTRLKSALIFAPPVLLILFFGGFGFTLMMTAAGAIGVYEWARMVLTGKDKVPVTLVSVAAGLSAIGIITGGMVLNPVTALVFLVALCFLLFAYNFAQDGPSPKALIIGILYIGFSVQVMIWIRNGLPNGLFHMMTLLFIVWGSDSFAYFTGRTLGGPKLAPSISPKKTWSGFFGSSIGAGLIAAAFAFYPVLTERIDIQTIGGLGYVGYFILGFILAMFGQAGDLLISVFKRHYGVKDTGTLIPGHGGILDRIDALLLVALIFGAIAFVLKP